MTDAKPLADVVKFPTGGMVSRKPSTDDLDLTTLPARLDDRALDRVKAIAAAPLPTLPAADKQHFARALRALDAALPKRHSDDVSGDLMAEVYARRLGHFPNAAISYLFNTAIDRCKWFPTVAECLEILEGWKRSDKVTRRRGTARRIVEGEMEQRLSEAMEALEKQRLSQDEINDLPERFRKIAVERCLLWPDFTPRPRKVFGAE